MAIFLDKLNVINYKISNEEHIWNLVYLNGKWYHLDLTWDDPISDINVNRDTYFLITTNTLEKINDGTHKFDKSIYIEAKKTNNLVFFHYNNKHKTTHYCTYHITNSII